MMVTVMASSPLTLSITDKFVPESDTSDAGAMRFSSTSMAVARVAGIVFSACCLKNWAIRFHRLGFKRREII